MTYQKRSFWKTLYLEQRTAKFIHERIAGKIKWWDQRKQWVEYQALKHWKDRVRRIFYRDSLGIFVEGEELQGEDPDGTVAYEDPNTLIIDWRSDCPILRDCQEQGIATLKVCSTLQHFQHQALLSFVCWGVLFSRDYSRLRPHKDHCREIIVHVPGIQKDLISSHSNGLGRAEPDHDFSEILKYPETIATFVHQKINKKMKDWNDVRAEDECMTDWKRRVLDMYYWELFQLTVEGRLPRGAAGHEPRGVVAYEDDHTLIIDWRNDCPVLEECRQQAVPTLPVCSALYHLQFQALLSLICPGVLFGRDYSRLRDRRDPKAEKYCREIFVYVPQLAERIEIENG